MTAEQMELYCYAKDHFLPELERISPTCVAPLIAIRQVVRKAIYKYCEAYCDEANMCFTNEDFYTVSRRLYEEKVGEL